MCVALLFMAGIMATITGSSRVFPTNSFLSPSVAPNLSKASYLSRCLDWLSRLFTRSNTTSSNRNQFNQRRSSKHSNSSRNLRKLGYNKREFISTLSDVFSITGGITTITGFLVASFGIFPRNQTSIRLYLEFIGCSMVIIGVLILFASLKLKPRSQVMAAPDDLIFFSSSAAAVAAAANNNNNNSNNNNNHRNDGNFTTHRHRLNHHHDYNHRHTSAAPIDSIHLKTPASVVQRQVTVCSEIQRMVEDETSRCDSFPDGTSNNYSSLWIPQDAYGNDHQAAIEAALSTVLAASTLVGFRAHQTASSDDQDNSHYCCIHHTIQHTMNAKRWIKKLRLTTRNVETSGEGGGGGRRQASIVGNRCDPLMLNQRDPIGVVGNRNQRENINETQERIEKEAETSFCE